MNIVGDLKEKVENAENMEEAKQIIEDAGMELSVDEMEQVAGGWVNPDSPLGKYLWGDRFK